MYNPSTVWRPIDTNIKNDVSVQGAIPLSRLVLVRSGARVAPARWRHPLERYNRSTKVAIKRQGAWWSERGKCLEFEPTEYRDL